MIVRCMSLKQVAALLGIVLTLAGCQSVPTADGEVINYTAESLQQRELKLRELTDFQFGGGLGIWTEKEAVPVRILWSQANDDLDVTFSGPIGLGSLKLEDKAGFVTLSRGKTVVTSGISADDVVQRGLGLRAPVPVDELKQWVRGLSGSGQAVVRDSDGRISSLQYVDASGVQWGVQFKRYKLVDGLSLPALITASGGEYSVRLVQPDGWLRPR